MATKDKDQGGSVASGGMIVAILVAASAFLIQKEAPLEGARPNAQETAFRGYAYHDIDARLWQDPFGAVEKKVSAEAPNSACATPTPSERAQTNGPKGTSGKAAATPALPPVEASAFEHGEHIKLEQGSRSQESTLILPVMVSGAPYAEDVEFRRRLRYAVVSALAQKHFQPADAQHIDYYRVCVIGLDDKPIKTVVPYEWFNLAPSSEAPTNLQSILILWINEQYLTDTIAKEKKPIKILEELTSPVFSALSGMQPDPSPVPVIGPHTSDAFLAIQKEGRPSRFKYMSYGATIAPNEVAKRQQDGSRQCSPMLGSATIERTITPDDILAGSLVDELEMRGVSYAKGHSIALVSEWDTTYGQAIRDNFKCAYRKSQSGLLSEPPSDQLRIIRKSYLRGIDGVIASDDRKSENQRSGKDADKKADDKEAAFDWKAARAGDRPHGPGQSDYLRRLTDSLIEDDTQIRLKGGAGIKAIGVLGSDVFDKLLVLRALKPNFPNAIFFTTDYDSILAMPGELAWTRNLIVASSFGPTLREDLQGDIPPFRSVYQASAFLAIQLAIDDRENPSRAEEIRKTLKKTQLFEIKRTGAYLPLPVMDAEARASSTNVQRDPPHAFPELPRRERFFIASLLAAGGCALLMLAFAPRQKANAIQHADFRTQASLFGLILLGTAIIVGAWEQLALFLTGEGAGEPIAWIDGVSVWPTIAIRLLVIILCWRIVALTSKRLDDNLCEIAKKLGLASPALVLQRLSRRRKLRSFNFARDFRPWLDILTPKKATFDRTANQDKPYKITAGWVQYVYAGRKNARHLRTALVSLLFLLMFCKMWSVYGNIAPPIRGDMARTLFDLSLPIEFLFISYAILYVTDATILCLCFVNDLEYHSTVWPSICDGRPRNQAPSKSIQAKIDDVRNDALDIEFIEMRTACILPLAYWPFLLVALTIIERSRIFANFPNSGVILFFTALALIIIVGCAFALNRAVEFARASSKRKIEDALFDYAHGNSTDSNFGQKLDVADRDHLKARLEKITNLDSGAFSPIWRQPLLKGLVLPIAGFASTVLFERNWFAWF
jgi:hypothetical protein